MANKNTKKKTTKKNTSKSTKKNVSTTKKTKTTSSKKVSSSTKKSTKNATAKKASTTNRTSTSGVKSVGSAKNTSTTKKISSPKKTSTSPKKKINVVENVDNEIIDVKKNTEELKVNVDTEKQYYHKLDLLRVIACFAVLLYHLNILKGGFLAVCTFLCLTGFLSCRSAFKKEKFSIWRYYLNRFVKLYIPLVVVVSITILVVSLTTSMSWFNIKPDATSVLLGYNNFWQIGANLDYFARHINSPFMHFWYIGILLQFELIFPIIYKILRTIGDKIKSSISYIIPFILAIISFIGFLFMLFKGNIMGAYYNTFTRLFSILLGIALGFLVSYKGSLVKKDDNKKVFLGYIIILLILFIFIDSQSLLLSLGMLLTTIISCRLIDYSINFNKKELNRFDKLIKFIASISYEIYLIQYPVIYMFQFINLNAILKVPIIIIIVIILSYLLHICVDFKNYFKHSFLNVLKYLLTIIVFIISIFGFAKYINLVDYTDEMKELESILEENEKELLKHQDEYLSKIEEEQASWEETLNNLKDDDESIKKVVDNLRVVGVGDSIMLGAVNNLYKIFKNGYFDAKVSRSIWAARDILKDLSSKKMLGDVVLINLGANGDCSSTCKKEIIESSGDRKVFFITVTNDDKVHVNDKFKNLAKEYDNVYVIDWAEYSKGHDEYFYADKIHLNGAGRKAYTQLIYDTLINVYRDEYQQIKEEIIKKHEEELKKKISFYGNDILISSSKEISNTYPEALIVTDKEFDFKKLKMRLKNDKENDVLSYRVVLFFDFQVRITEDEYRELLEICDNNELYVLSTNMVTNNLINNIDNEHIHLLDFYSEIKNHDEYLMKDYIHLTEEGIKALGRFISILD